MSYAKNARYQHNTHIPMIGLPLNDIGDMRRFVTQHDSHLRFVDGVGWHYWNGEYWKRDDTITHECATHTVDMMFVEAQRAQGKDEEERNKNQEEMRDHARSSTSEYHRRVMVREAQQHPDMRTEATNLDRDEWLLNTPDGIVDVRTGDSSPHNPDRLMTKHTNGNWRPDSWHGSRWEAFLERNIPNLTDRNYLQQWAGYSATGTLAAKEKAFLILFGTTDTGKNTFSEAIIHALGTYAGVVPTSVFVSLKQGRNNSHQEDIASSLPGKRLGVAAELNDGEVLSIAQIKSLTGDETMWVSKKHGHLFPFRPTAKLWLHTNKMPDFRGADAAIQNRLKVVHFDERIPLTERDSTLGDKLKAEADAVLSWVIEGAIKYYRTGRLIAPEYVEAEAARLVAESDVLAMFLDECAVELEDEWTNHKKLYEVYSDWCEDNGHHPYGKVNFKKHMVEKGFVWRKREGYDGWKGLDLIPSRSFHAGR